LAIANRKIKKRLLEIDGEVVNRKKMNEKRQLECDKIRQAISEVTEKHNKILEAI